MKFGSIDIDRPIVLAPMEDVTDTAFRLICKRLGADMVYTEFTSCEALIRDIPRALKKIKITEEERPIGIQIFGGVDASMEEAAKRIEEFGPDFIDINCGCWVKNHVARGEGAALLKDLPNFERVVQSVVKATRLPVTVKTRLGWDAQSIVILDVARMVEQAGAKALTVHCRTRSQAHRGEADWGWLEKIKKVISIPLIGNGDINSPEDVKRMFETGCDGVMIGRGAIHNPWLFQQTKHFLKTGTLLPPPTLKEKIALCIEHLTMAVELKGQRDGVLPFRKHYVGYLKGVPHVAHLRSDLMRLTDSRQIIDRFQEFLEEKTLF
ncbi:MAG TPA: tRNA dihydrouridine synthase DusB [Candidatus Omnitrophica bacterium]|nr:MAG: tRNA dihydrouridine synthase DusB [Omnitrophica WOR_2 bacterium GWA2_45_18]HBR15404.1 tRNA dihydrouridine synthase DusB [Candidatus Omnitrophota bacterium]